MSILFERETQTATFHSPLEDFEPVEVEVEVRMDPLTERQTRVVPESFLIPEGEPDIEEAVTDDEGCFFCPEMVTEATPEYAESIGMDRGSHGEATSFPNLNPYGAYSNVVALTEDHYVPIDGFTTEQMADGLSAAVEYIRAVVAEDENATFASVNMNFLPAAGSSIVHPHMQTLVDDRATNQQRLFVASARAHHAQHGSAYWIDLAREERGSDRWIGSTGSVDWVAPYAPKHHYHALGVIDDVGVPEPGSTEISDLAAGITNVLEYYASLGLNSFNLALYLVEDDETFPPVLSLVARSVFERYYWSDSPFFVTLHDESVVDVPPEEYASEAAEHF